MESLKFKPNQTKNKWRRELEGGQGRQISISYQSTPTEATERV